MQLKVKESCYMIVLYEKLGFEGLYLPLNILISSSHLQGKRGKKPKRASFARLDVCGVTYGHLQNYWSELKFLI